MIAIECTQKLKRYSIIKIIMSDQTIIFWWPDSIFYDVHWTKDPGSIPLELERMGYKVILVVGEFNSSLRYKELDIVNTFNKARSASVSSNIASRMLRRIIGVTVMLRLTHKYCPNAIIIEHDEAETLFFALLLKAKFPFITKAHPRLILKLDVDPESAKVSNKRFIFILVRHFFSFIFDKIICESECAYDELTKPKLILKYKSKYMIIPNGFWDTQEDRITERSIRYNRILSVGRISFQKGHDILIHVFSKLRDRFPDWKLIIVGLSDDRLYRESLEKEIADLKLGDSVNLLTDLNDEQIIMEYKKATIFCLLSRWEGFGIARSEAIHYGLPLVITEAGCGIMFKKFGSRVCRIDDQDCIINALETLILNENLRQEISDKQKATILTWHDVAVEFSRLIPT